MVRAILDGRKTMTRRVVKCIHNIKRIATPEEWNYGRAHPNMRRYEEWGPRQGCGLFESDDGSIFAMPCPYGPVGDRLWVREKFGIYARGDSTPHGKPYDPEIFYAATDEIPDPLVPHVLWEPFRWKPSIHMPKKYARIWLEITGVRVERLKAMSFYDWVADFCPYPVEKEKALATFIGMDNMHQMAQKFWDSINKKKHPWSSNPWVWVIEFKRINPKRRQYRSGATSTGQPVAIVRDTAKPESDLTGRRVTVQTVRLIGAKPKRSNPDSV